MNEKLENELDDDLRSEYDFANMQGGVRGKYVERYREGTNVIGQTPPTQQKPEPMPARSPPSNKAETYTPSVAPKP
jgi:hypothetical protein